MTVRAAIIGLGRWGHSLVNAVHGKTDAIKFVAAYTRTRANAEDYCREKNIPLLDRFIGRLRESGLPVQTGSFGAQMAVRLVNDGPVTIVMSTDLWEPRIG